MRALLYRLTCAVLLGIVFWHYQWTASSSGNPFAFGEKKTDYYNLLADAFLAGQLPLLIRPHTELVRLADPYKPEANAPFRAHLDFSLYQGKYYLYFGAAPVLTLFIPFRLLLGMDIPEGFAAVTFMFAGLLFSLSTLHLLIRRFYPETPRLLMLLLVPLLAFSGFAPFILRRVLIYEVAVSAGFCFLSGGLYGLLRGALSERRRSLWFALGSLLLGLAVGSRPHHALAAPLLLAAYLYATRQAGRPGADGRWRMAAALAGPFLACGAGIAFYNYARFGSILEFGQTYVLDAYDHPRVKLLSLSYLPSHLFVLLLAPPSVDLNFPFFHLYPAVFPPLPHSRSVFESISGLIPCVPLTTLAFLSPLLLTKRLRGKTPLFPLAANLALLGLALALITFVSCFLVCSARYFADFCPLLLLVTGMTWVHLDARLRPKRLLRGLVNGGLILLWAYGIMVNLGVGLTGYYDLFRKRNPAAYASIEDRFLWLQRWLISHNGGYGDIRLQLRFPTAPQAGSEALVAVDNGAASHVLCVRYGDAGEVAFKFFPPSGEAVRSELLAVDPHRPHVVEVSMGSLRPPVNERVASKLLGSVEDPRKRFSIRLDGQEVLRGSVALDVALPAQVHVGANATKAAHCQAAFSGEVLEVRRTLGRPSPGGP